ncbi:MAG: hypothetical protein NWR47_05600, partial [Aestuariivirgaceae bacterium]|nr:hypothetical protein [Aestuariivirgaceae bacterium]
MLRAISEPDKVTFAKDGAVIFCQLTFKNEKLLIAIVPVRACGEAGRHSVNMKPHTQRMPRIDLQNTVT